jgi:chemotaxis protein MotA
MFHLIGFFAVFVLSQAAFHMLGVESRFYFDEIALMVVVGGTLSVAIITYPMRELRFLFTSLFGIFQRNDISFEDSAVVIVDMAQKSQVSQSAIVDASQNEKHDTFLRDGFDLLLSGLSQDEIQDILTERIYRERLRDEKQVSLLRGLAKYPPAFGLIGTVLGLVSLMRTIGDGTDTSGIGLRMALALVATLYGLTFANFFLVPLAEHFNLKAERTKNLKELQMEGLLMLFQKRSPLAVQEMMNSYLDENEKIDLIGLKEAA